MPARKVMIGYNVRFSKKSEAETAIAHLHGHFFQGLTSSLFFLASISSQEQAEGLK